MLLHQTAQNQRGVEVVVIVLQRLLGGLADGLVTGEMDYGVDVVLCKDLVQSLFIAAVNVICGEVLAGYFAHALERLGLAVIIIVNNDDFVTRVKQLNAGMRADISGAAGD